MDDMGVKNTSPSYRQVPSEGESDSPEVVELKKATQNFRSLLDDAVNAEMGAQDFDELLNTIKKQRDSLENQYNDVIARLLENGDEELAKFLQSQLASLQSLMLSLLSGKREVSSLAASDANDLDAKPKSRAVSTNSSEPAIPPSRAEGPPETVAVNMYLAQAMIAVQFMIMLEVAAALEEIKDVQRLVKQLGYENIMEFAEASAEIAYEKGMLEAQKLWTQMGGAIAGAAVQGAMIVGMFCVASSEREKLIEQKNSMKDNQTWENQAQAEFKDKLDASEREQYIDPGSGNLNKSGEQAFWEKTEMSHVTPESSKVPIDPGAKQYQQKVEAIDAKIQKLEAEKQKIEQGAIDVRSAKDQEIRELKLEKQKYEQLATQKDQQAAMYDVSAQLTSNLFSNPNMQAMQMFGRMLPELIQGIVAGIQADMQQKIAALEAEAVKAQAAQQVSDKLLAAALESFSGLLQEISRIFENLQQSSQKSVSQM